MNEWRLVCPVGRLPVGRMVTALLDGVQVVVRRGEDGTVRAVATCGGVHGVRIQNGVVEVSLRPVVPG